MGTLAGMPLKSEVPALGERYEWKPGLKTSLTAAALNAKMSLERNIQEGRYLFENVACFCGAIEGRQVSTRDRYDLYYSLILCERCGILRANPRMTGASYAQFYDQEYRALYGEDDDRLAPYFEAKVKEGERILAFVIESVPARSMPKVVFDVGCNMGSMLVPWKGRGCEVQGVDFNQRRIQLGRELSGIPDLYVGGVDELVSRGRKADLVILSHTLEHFLDLSKTLSKVRSMLAPGGYAYVELPGTFWWIRHVCCGDILGLLQNAHTYQFSLATLRYVMECSGFEMVRGTEEIVSLFRVGERYRSRDDVPRGEAQRVMTYLKRCELMNTPRRYLSRVADRLGVKQVIRKLLYA